MIKTKKTQNIRDMYILLIIVIAVSLVIFWMFWSLPKLSQENENVDKKEDFFAKQNIGILSYRLIDYNQADKLEMIIINNYESSILLQNISIGNQFFDLGRRKLDSNAALEINITIGSKCVAGDYYSYELSFGLSQNQSNFLYKFPKKIEGQCINV